MAKVLSTSRVLNTDVGLLQRLRDVGHDVEVVDRAHLDERAMSELAVGCSALVVGTEPVTATVIDAAPDLRVVARPGVGYDRVDVRHATRRGVWVTITPGANTASVADHTLALILASLRRLVELHAAVALGEWPRVIATELHGLVLGLVGLGAIGRAVAERARGFGMEIVAHDPVPDVEFATRHGIALVTLDELVAAADVVSLHAPLTDETTGLFDAGRFDKCKRGAILVNTARGGLVVEDDLVQAVRNGRLSGAALDVLNVEPPVGSAIRGNDRILLTPHTAAYTSQALHRMATGAVDSVLAAFAGELPHGVVNPDARRTTDDEKERSCP